MKNVRAVIDKEQGLCMARESRFFSRSDVSILSIRKKYISTFFRGDFFLANIKNSKNMLFKLRFTDFDYNHLIASSTLIDSKRAVTYYQ